MQWHVISEPLCWWHHGATLATTWPWDNWAKSLSFPGHILPWPPHHVLLWLNPNEFPLNPNPWTLKQVICNNMLHDWQIHGSYVFEGSELMGKGRHWNLAHSSDSTDDVGQIWATLAMSVPFTSPTGAGGTLCPNRWANIITITIILVIIITLARAWLALFAFHQLPPVAVFPEPLLCWACAKKLYTVNTQWCTSHHHSQVFLPEHPPFT